MGSDRPGSRRLRTEQRRPRLQVEPLGWPGWEVGDGDGSEVRLRQTEGRRSLADHACFLRVGRGNQPPPAEPVV